MKLLIDARLMERFLSMRPKLFVAAGDEPCDFSILSTGDDPHCDIWVMEALPEHDHFRLRLQQQSAEEFGELVPLLQPPATICIMAARRPGAHADLEALRSWWSAHGPNAAPAIQPLNGSPTSAAWDLLRPLLVGALTELHQTAVQHTSLAAQLYALRTEHEQTQAALQALQHQQGHFHQGTQLFANLPPSGRVFSPTQESGTLIQYLPMAAAGLAAVDLHFPPAQTRPQAGHLLIRLDALDRDQPLGIWRLPAASLGVGWVRCAFAEALRLAAYDLQLSVSWCCPSRCQPSISLAETGDWHELRAQNECGTALEGALALMLWTAAPGTQFQEGIPCGTFLPGQSCAFRLNQFELDRAVLSSPEGTAHPNPWTLVVQPQRLLLHPEGPQANVGYIPFGCLSGIQQVTAIVKIDHPQAASHIEYAMLATRHEPVCELPRLADPAGDPRVQAFSGWQLVPPDQQPHAVCLHFAEPLAQPAHLVLATRTQGSTTYAWACWLEFRMCFRAPRRAFENENAGQTNSSPIRLLRIPA
jgi:hypothetical protein